MPKSITVHGCPKEFDAFLRPPVRMVQVTVGLLLTGVVAWYQIFWAIPLPLAASFLMYELFFWSRADKPIRVRMSPKTIQIDDPFLKKHQTLQLDTVRSATVIHRDHHTGADEVVVLLGDTAGPAMGLQFLLPTDSYTPIPGDVDADLCNAVLGAISGLIRAVCPREKLIRQPLGDPRGIAWLRAQLGPDIWARSGARYWEGEDPELDLFGYHAGAPTGWMELDGDQITWTEGTTQALDAGTMTRSERVAVLFRMDGEEHSESPEPLPMWRQPVGGRTVAIPAPLLNTQTPHSVRQHSDCHVHAPEGAVLLWHLWSTLPPDRWPEGWAEALADAQPHVRRWPPGLPSPLNETPV